MLRNKQIFDIADKCDEGQEGNEFLVAFAYAIESAACAERDARIAELEKDCDRLERYWNEAMATHKNIAELEQQLAEARKDAERYRFIRDADRSDCITQELSLYAMETLDEYVDAAMEGEAELAIRAAIKEQT